MQMPLQLWEDEVPLYDSSIDQPRPTLTPYLVEGEAVRGAVIVCPGGGYVNKSAKEGEPIARVINGFGIHAFVLEYRVAPYVHPAMLLDAQRAIRMVRHNAARWNIDPAHVAILGFSAGGHLTTMAATHYDLGDPHATDPIDRHSCRPDAFLPCYAVCSFIQHYHAGSRKNATGKDYLSPVEARYFSAEYNVTSDTPPAFLWHTAQDPSVPVENSLNLALALSAHSVPFSLHVFPYGRHGIDLAVNNPLAHRWPSLMGDWLTEHGF